VARLFLHLHRDQQEAAIEAIINLARTTQDHTTQLVACSLMEAADRLDPMLIKIEDVEGLGPSCRFFPPQQCGGADVAVGGIDSWPRTRPSAGQACLAEHGGLVCTCRSQSWCEAAAAPPWCSPSDLRQDGGKPRSG